MDKRRFRSWWGAPEYSPPTTGPSRQYIITPIERFCDAYGYDFEDIEAIEALEVGETHRMFFHTVTRLTDRKNAWPLTHPDIAHQIAIFKVAA